mgnify:CR=1 FL=1
MPLKFLLAVLIGLMGMYAIGLVIGWMRYKELRQATLKGFVAGFPDAAFMGIPILHSLFGPSSLITLLNNPPPYWSTSADVRKKRVGDQTTDAGRAFLLQRSPLTFA